MVKLFISYRSLDSAEVDAIVSRLTAIKTIDSTPPYTVWQDKKSILSGQDWWQAIIDAIIDCEVFIYMVSRESVRNSNCRAELSYARKRNRPVIAMVLPGEFFYNPDKGKHDIDYWDDIPEDLDDLRSQFLFYEGASFLPKLQAGIDDFLREPKRWRDMPADRPRDPRLASDETNNTAALYDEACDYAWRCEFHTAERLFIKLVHMNDPDFGDEAHAWVLLLRDYQKLLNFDGFTNTRHRVYPAWERYLEQFPKPFTPLFDPKGFKARLAGVPQVTKEEVQEFEALKQATHTVWVVDGDVIEQRRTAYELEFDVSRPPIEGGEGWVFFSRDNKYVLKFYKEHIARSKDPRALTEIIKAAPDATDERFKLFGFPLGLLVDSPQTLNFLGILMRNVTQECWLEELIWYDHILRFRGLVQDKPDRIGTFWGRVKAAIQIADAISYLNFKGFAQGDISGRNFLINPDLGRAVLIDLDGLAVPGFMESGVLGTPGYMAPELVAGMQDGSSVRPTIQSDRHALATMLFGLLLMHHPLLDGEMPALANDANADKLLRMGRKALYVHHRTDKRNAAPPNFPSPTLLGEEMEKLFYDAFVDGLFDPGMRPLNAQWKAALERLLDDVVDCENPNCWWGAFPSQDGSVAICPMCGTSAKKFKFIF